MTVGYLARGGRGCALVLARLLRWAQTWGRVYPRVPCEIGGGGIDISAIPTAKTKRPFPVRGWGPVLKTVVSKIFTKILPSIGAVFVWEVVLADFPTSIADKDDPTRLTFCRWCGSSLNGDKRKRYCCKEHERLWVDEVLLAEAFWRQRELAIKRDKHTCQECGVVITRSQQREGFMHVHHIIPRHEGGSNNHGNLKTLCKPCHIDIHKGR